MSEKTKQLKDLEPKAEAKNVKGGIFCLLGGVANAAYRAVHGAEAKVRKALDPR